MENYFNVKRLALVLAVQAEIEGMKAENEVRKSIDNMSAYNEDAFFIKAEELRTLAYKLDEQL